MKTCPVCGEEKEKLGWPRAGLSPIAHHIFGDFREACRDCIKGPLRIHMNGNGSNGIWSHGTKPEVLDGFRVKFTCPLGHVSIRDYSKGPKARQINSKWGLEFLVKKWDRGRVIAKCKACVKIEKSWKEKKKGKRSPGR